MRLVRVFEASCAVLVAVSLWFIDPWLLGVVGGLVGLVSVDRRESAG